MALMMWRRSLGVLVRVLARLLVKLGLVLGQQLAGLGVERAVRVGRRQQAQQALQNALDVRRRRPPFAQLLEAHVAVRVDARVEHLRRELDPA